MNKSYNDYYPNRMSNNNAFEMHKKNISEFREYCRGKEVFYFEDEGDFDTKLNIGDISEEDAVKRAFLLQDFFIWNNWRLLGKNIFHFSNEILSLLNNTDVLDIDLSLIKLPYSNFYIDFSEINLPFVEEGLNNIEGVYINEEIGDGVDFDKVLTFDFTGDYINSYWKINVELDWDHGRGFHSYSLFMDRNTDLMSVKDSINFEKDGFVGSAIIDDRNDDTKVDLYLIHSQFIDRTIPLVINCLLYLTSNNKDVKEDYPIDLPERFSRELKKAKTERKLNKIENEISKNGFTKIKYIGTKYYDNTNTNVNQKDKAVHWRRGHWRNQKFGNNLLETKLVWIMPTLVNSSKNDGTEIKGHIYDV